MLKFISPDVELSPSAQQLILSILRGIASAFAKGTVAPDIASLQQTVPRLVPRELGKHAQSQMLKALAKFGTKDDTVNGVGKASGLSFPVFGVQERLKEDNVALGWP